MDTQTEIAEFESRVAILNASSQGAPTERKLKEALGGWERVLHPVNWNFEKYEYRISPHLEIFVTTHSSGNLGSVYYTREAAEQASVGEVRHFVEKT